MSRKAPQVSATIHAAGKCLRGSDGVYQVVVDKNKRKYWAKRAKVYRGKLVVGLAVFGKPKLLGMLTVKGALEFGDTVPHHDKDYRAGTYYIYAVGHGLMAAKHRVSGPVELVERGHVSADVGRNCFRDSATTELLGKCQRDVVKRETGRVAKFNTVGEYLMAEFNAYAKGATVVRSIVYEDILHKKNKKAVEIAAQITECFAKIAPDVLCYTADNHYGDGYFTTMVDKRRSMLLLCGRNEQFLLEALRGALGGPPG